MNKTFNENEFKELLNNVLMEIVDDATDQDCHSAAMGIMLTGALVIQNINNKIFDEDTESITITKE